MIKTEIDAIEGMLEQTDQTLNKILSSTVMQLDSESDKQQITKLLKNMLTLTSEFKRRLASLQEDLEAVPENYQHLTNLQQKELKSFSMDLGKALDELKTQPHPDFLKEFFVAYTDSLTTLRQEIQKSLQLKSFRPQFLGR